MSLDNTSHGRPGDALRRAAKRFLNEYRSQMRPFETGYEVTPGVLLHRTGGHTPGHSVVRLASGGDRLTFAGDAVFQVRAEPDDRMRLNNGSIAASYDTARIFGGLGFGSSTASRSIISRPRRTGLCSGSMQV